MVRELDGLQDRLVALGDPDGELAGALDDRQQRLQDEGGPTAERLTEIAAELR